MQEGVINQKKKLQYWKKMWKPRKQIVVETLAGVVLEIGWIRKVGKRRLL